MRSARNLFAIALATTFVLSATTFAGTISGTVKFDGTPPKMRPLQMDADPGCAKKHTEPQMPEMLVLGSGNTMANVFVRVKSVPGTFKAPSEPVVLDQHGCMYVPHVAGVMVGQKFVVKNSDGLLHNVHSLPKINQSFNRAMPAAVTEAEYSFDKEELFFKVKCDVHPWMNAFVGVMTHPFYDVTATDGKFEISGLPAGTYELIAWHEKLGEKSQTVTVGADDTKTADFSMAVPQQ